MTKKIDWLKVEVLFGCRTILLDRTPTLLQLEVDLFKQSRKSAFLNRVEVDSYFFPSGQSVLGSYADWVTIPTTGTVDQLTISRKLQEREITTTSLPLSLEDIPAESVLSWKLLLRYLSILSLLMKMMPIPYLNFSLKGNTYESKQVWTPSLLFL